jgi:hypothetical protein
MSFLTTLNKNLNFVQMLIALRSSSSFQMQQNRRTALVNSVLAEGA